jgi:hypothetical protein
MRDDRPEPIDVAEILSGRRSLVENHRVLRRIAGGLNVPPEMMGLSWWGPDGYVPRTGRCLP